MIVKPTAKNLLLAGKILKSGGIVAIPTETFYALCVNSCDEKAIRKIIKIKGRKAEKGISIILKNTYQLRKFLNVPNSKTKKLIAGFWPGPLSLIFKNKELPKILEGKNKSILARVSSDKVLSKILNPLPFPITATSANISGRSNPISPKYVLKSFGNSVDLIIDGGKLISKKPSTIVDSRKSSIKILREGKISEKQILSVLK